MQTKLFILLGFTVGTVAGFIYGKKVNENVPSNINTSYESGVVTIKADVGNLAKQSLNDAKADIAVNISEWWHSL